MKPHNLFTAILTFTLLLTLIAMPTSAVYAATGPLCYVDADATSGGDTGNSWSDAYLDLQDALTDANCTEIWVAAGTYTPTSGTDRSISFVLKSGVAVYGGFAGTESARDQRDPAANLTTLSGDLNGNDSGFTNNDENSYTVVVGSGTTATAVLDGFTISGGNADGLSGLGGGMFNDAGSPTLVNLVFSSNNARNGGGGMHNENSSNPTLTNVTFSGNTANHYGGGMSNDKSSPTLTDVTFSGNAVPNIGKGGGMYNYDSNPTLTNVTFSGNTATNGGGMYNAGTSPTLTNVTFNGNTATNGGGMYNVADSSTLTNVTFSGNTANAGGGMYNDDSNPTLKNVILWGNVADDTGNEIFNGYLSSASISYSVVRGSGGSTSWDTTLGTDGGGNLDADPKLGSLASNGGFTQTLALGTGSSAIDAGTNTGCPGTDQRGVTRPLGAACDIGAYEAGAAILTVTDNTPTSGVTLTSLTTIDVTFSEAALADSSAKAANNTANYLLVEAGTNASFDTLSCAGGLQSDDSQVTLSGAVYDSASKTATLSFASLSAGNYRLFICGTTSIWSAAGLELNNGASDTTINFTIQGAVVPVTSASSLPTTGFRHGQVTQLAEQPAAKAYTETAMTLEIPKLGVNTVIVGVAQSGSEWDVTWLGNSAGYLAGSAFPTWAGNTVITGHVWDAYDRPGIFAELKSLKYGDQIEIHAWGQTYTYEVRESKLVTTKNTDTVFQSEQYDWVTLVTCEFYNPFSGEYLFRRAVRAVLVSVK